jgi:hypothetical protein
MATSSVAISATLKAKAERQAKREGMSLTRLVSQSIENHLAGLNKRRLDPARDSFFLDDFLVEGGPSDVAENHDKYLTEIRERELERNGHGPRPARSRRKR